MLAATIEFVPQPNWARRGPPLLADQLAYDRIVHRCSPFRVPNSRKQSRSSGRAAVKLILYLEAPGDLSCSALRPSVRVA